MELEVAASTVEVSDTGLVISWSDGRRSRFHALWLRHNSGRGEELSNPAISVTDLNPEIFVLDAERDDEGDLVVEFSDGHESVIRFDWLEAHSHEVHDRLRVGRQLRHLRVGSTIDRFDLPRQGSTRHADLLDSVALDGAAIVNGVPDDESGTEMVAELFGSARSTEDGPVVDIVMAESGWEFSDEGLALDLHTSDSFRYAPPGVSIVHSVAEPDGGGEWVLVDGFATASDLRDHDPDAFDLLTEEQVVFEAGHRAANADPRDHLRATAPIISLDRDHEICGVRFDEGRMGPLDIDPRQVGDYYRALITFAKELHDPGRAIHVRLGAGQALVRDNDRMLQGRAAVGPTGSGGHVRLCGVDRDQFHARLRHLRTLHERAAVGERLPRGSH